MHHISRTQEYIKLESSSDPSPHYNIEVVVSAPEQPGAADTMVHHLPGPNTKHTINIIMGGGRAMFESPQAEKQINSQKKGAG